MCRMMTQKIEDILGVNAAVVKNRMREEEDR